MTVQRAGRKRLSVDIPIAIHRQLQRLAKKKNITLTKLVIRQLVDLIKQEQKYD